MGRRQGEMKKQKWRRKALGGFARRPEWSGLSWRRRMYAHLLGVGGPEELIAFARRLDWSYSPWDKMILPGLHAVGAMNKMTYVWNVFEGRFENHHVRVFMMASKMASNERGYPVCFQLEHGGDFPLVDIIPAGPRDEASIVSHGAPDMKLGDDPLSDEFSKVFRVVALDGEFARSICNKDMMKGLLHLSDFGIYIIGNRITLYEPRKIWKRDSAGTYGREAEPDECPVLTTEKIEARLHHLMEIWDMFPAGLRDKPAAQDVPQAGRPREIKKAQRKFPAISVVALILANTVPLFGVIFLGWSAATILILLCFENILIGFLNVPKMALCPVTAPFDSRGVPLSPAERETMSKLKLSNSKGWNILLKIITIPVLYQVYGGFVFAQIALLVFILDQIPGASESISPLALSTAAAPLMLSHGISFFVNFIGRGEFRRTGFVAQAFRPYGRVFVMTLTVAFGGGLSIILDSPVWALAVLVLLKIGTDVRAHMAERKKYSEAVKK